MKTQKKLKQELLLKERRVDYWEKYHRLPQVSGSVMRTNKLEVII